MHSVTDTEYVKAIESGRDAAIFASRGGSVKSDAKRTTAQANGRKGGRPRKTAA